MEFFVLATEIPDFFHTSFEGFIPRLISNTISIFSIMNPVSAGIIMLTMLDDDQKTGHYIQGVAMRSTTAIGIGLLATLFMGALIMEAFGISVHSIRVIGGVVLFLTALNMIQGGRPKAVNHNTEDAKYVDEREDIAVIPLGIPIIFGPGLMATIIGLDVMSEGWVQLVNALLASMVCVLANYLILRNMIYISRLLGFNGMRILTRVMGLIVGAISSQFFIHGVKGVWNMP